MQTKKFDTSLWGSSACRKLINCLMFAIFHQMTQHPSHAMDRLDPVHNLGGTPFCLGFPIAPPLFPLSISNLIHVFHCLSVRSNSVYSCLFSMLYWFHLCFSQSTHIPIIPAPPWIVDVVDVIVDVIVAALAPGLDGLSFETVSPAAECLANLHNQESWVQP